MICSPLSEGPRLRDLRGAAVALVLCVPVAQAQFVERALQVGLDHQVVPGMDHMIGPAPDFDIVMDWAQQGLALGDLDGDGDPDLVAAGGLDANTLFRNDGGTFVDVTAGSGLESREFDRCVYLADYDADGDLDIFCGAYEGGETLGAGVGRSRLYRNDGAFQFTDVTSLSGTIGSGRTLSGAWADFDKDGLLDLYLGEFHHAPNLYYQNNGDGTFSERATALGIDWRGSTHAVVPLDSDDDELLDLFLGIDFDVQKVIGVPLEENFGNACYSGLAGGFFSDVSAGSGYDIDNAPMGASVADIDYDGDPDIYESDIGANPLFVNYGWPGTGVPWEREERDYGIDNPTVLPPGGTPGVDEQKTSGWAVIFFDADHDLWFDLFVANGHVAGKNPFTSVMDREQQNFYYQGEGPPIFRLLDETATVGLDDHIDDRAAAVGDVDGDGDLDLVVVPTVGRMRFFENQLSTTDGSIQVDLVTGTSAPGGIGSVVRWTDSMGHPHTRWVGSDAPTASQNEPRVHFGVGAEPSVDLEVTFPSGMQIDVPGVLPNTETTVVEPEMIRLSTRSLSIPMASLPGEPDEVTVTAFAYDQDGTMLDGTAVVTIDAGTLVPTGPVQHVAGNEFQRTFDGANSPGSHRVVVTFDAWQVGIEPVVHVTGLMSGVRSIVRAIPEAVRAGSGDPFIVDVAPRDNASRSIGPNHPVTVDVVGFAQAPAVDLGNGLYRASFTAPPAPGTYDIDVTVQGLPLAGPTLEVAGACDGAASDVVYFAPYPAQSATPHQFKVLFTPRDASGRRLGPEANISLELAQLPGGPSRLGPPAGSRSRGGAQPAGPKPGAPLGEDPFLDLRDDLTGARDDGSYLFVFEKPQGSPELPSGTFTVVVDGTPVTTETFHFNPQQ